MCRPALALAFALAALPAFAREPDQAALEAFWKARRDEVARAEPLPAESAPKTGEDGDLACPTHGAAMRLVDLGEGAAAAVCSAGWEVWIRIAHADAVAWRGPYEVPPAAKPVDRAAVLAALMKHITDSGDQGFYADRFANVKELGPGAVSHLFAIYGSSDDEQIRYLAIEALGEVAGKDVIPELQRLARDPESSRHALGIAVALYRLGDTSLIDRMLEADEARLARTEDAREKSQIHSGMAIVLTKCGKEDESLGHYREAVDLDPTNQIAAYNLACGYSKLGRVDDGLAALETALKAGFDQWEWMMVDADLARVREDPRFRELFDRHRK